MVREGIVAKRTDTLRTVDSMFDRFAAIFHAFSMLREHVVAAIEAGREKEAVYRLFGEKYDSLPSLIRKVLEDHQGDAVNRYITLLTAQDTLGQLEKEYDAFFQEASARPSAELRAYRPQDEEQQGQCDHPKRSGHATRRNGNPEREQEETATLQHAFGHEEPRLPKQPHLGEDQPHDDSREAQEEGTAERLEARCEVELALGWDIGYDQGDGNVEETRSDQQEHQREVGPDVRVRAS